MIIHVYTGYTYLLLLINGKSCADPESFVRGGPTWTTFFLLDDEGREDPSTTISGPLSAHQGNAINGLYC